MEKNGITIVINGKSIKVYFALLSIISDNLGLNSLLGYTRSFNAPFVCRMCRADKSQRACQLEEVIQLLRTKDNYSEDVMSSSHGVIEECVFNTIPSYHVTANFSVDFMHDLFEGICRYDMGRILYNLIYGHDCFSLETLNWNMNNFDHGSVKGKNIIKSLAITAIKNKHIIISASEMKTLVKYLGFYVGHSVSEDIEEWQLWVLLRQIIRIVTSSKFTPTIVPELEKLVYDHHALFIKIFDEPLKPKYHFLVHYSRLLMLLGPLTFYCTMRFEGKHKSMKDIGKNTTLRVNPAHTLAIKHQQNFIYRLFSKVGFSSRREHRPELMNSLSHDEEYALFSHMLPMEIENDYSLVSWVSLFGTSYEIGMVLNINSCNEALTFAQIQYILIINDDTGFLYKKMKIVNILNYIQAYEVIEAEDWGWILQNDLYNYEPYDLLTTAKGQKCVSFQ